MSDPTDAVRIQGLCHRYGPHRALNDVSLQIGQGEIFAFLGPNGGGKTTLFRLLSTLMPLQQGEVQVLGWDVRRDVREVRRRIGVVFQAPSLDRKLTVAENVAQQAALYGLAGRQMDQRRQRVLRQLGLEDRAGQRAEQLSGGLRRRVELAKGMIHHPRLLLLDEPSTGLDPGVRLDLWASLEQLRSGEGVTILLTTHILEEAEKTDRIAILDQGRMVALGRPEQLRAEVGGDAITIETDHPAALIDAIRERLQVEASLVDGRVRLERPEGHRWVAKLVETFPEQIRTITLGRPTLEDVFIDKTGHRFWHDDA